MTINEQIEELKQQIIVLQNKVADLSKNTEEKIQTPISIVGGTKNESLTRPADVKAGRSQQLGGYVIFNDSELKSPRIDTEPDAPTEGYNKHTHSRYSGGALIKDVLEIVEYTWGSITNKHSQQFWSTKPPIATVVNSLGQTVQKVGKLDLVFNPDGGTDALGNPIGTWGVAAYEIDIKKCFFVERVTVTDSDNPTLGAIKKDSKGQEMKSPLYNSDQTKTSIIWDENGKVWRLYAAFAPGV